MAEVAVAVVSWNTRELLERCLRSLKPDVDAGRAEVWVVDNGSTDGSRELVRTEFPWVRLEEPDSNLGFGPAVNLVAARTSTPWIAPANADVEFRADTLANLLAAAARAPWAGALAPRLERPNGEAEHSVHPFPGVGVFAASALGAATWAPALADRLCLEGAWNSWNERDVPVGRGRAPARAPASLGRGGRVRRRPVDVRRGHGPRMADAEGRLAHPLRAGRARDPHRRRRGGAGLRHRREQRWMDASYTWAAKRLGRRRARTLALTAYLGAALRSGALAVPALLRPGRYRPRRDEAKRWMAIHRRGLRA